MKIFPADSGSAASGAREIIHEIIHARRAKGRRLGDPSTHPGRYVILVLTGIFGALASFGMFVEIGGWQDHLAELRFTSLARDDLQTLDSGLTDTIDVVRSIRAYMESVNHPITREEYQAFSSSLRERAVGMRDTGWAPRVAAADRDTFERTIRASGWPDFQIVEFGADHKMVRAKDRPEYFPIIYSDPGPANRPVMGFDFASEPVRSQTLARAVAADAPSVTPPLKLVNQKRPVGGMMGFIPVSGKRQADSNAPAPLAGIVGGVFETVPMIENILATKLHLTNLDIYVFDPNGSEGNRLIYWHSPSGKPAPAEAVLLASQHWQGVLQLADQQWGVIFAPTTTFDDAADWTAVAALAAGLGMTGLVVGYLGLTLRRTRQLEKLTTNLRETSDELRRNGAKLDHLARHDALTGLANRMAFRDAVDSVLRHANRGHGLAIHYLDLDRFKTVNDTLGHPAGDNLLCQVADRLRQSVRQTDTVSRLGGDEFAIAQVWPDQPQAAETLGRRLVDLLSRPYNIAGQLVMVGVSVGITLADRGDQDVDHLLRQADMALYAAKRNGRGTWRFFEPAMELGAQAWRGLEMDLRHALEHEELELHYQPQIDIINGCVRGFEALLRWHHPDRGLVMPGDFIRCAEETGLILPIGSWVLATALRDAAHWPAGIRVSINISPHQLAHDDLAIIVEAELAAVGQPGARLELEMTESALIQHDVVGQTTLRRLRTLGVQVAMDDFGTGYASLSHLRSFPFDRIKIDQSFVASMTNSREGAAIVRAILQLAATLDIATTAEGVQTPNQLAMLVVNGCREAQGLLFGPPCPASEVPRLLAGWPSSARNVVPAAGPP